MPAVSQALRMTSRAAKYDGFQNRSRYIWFFSSAGRTTGVTGPQHHRQRPREGTKFYAEQSPDFRQRRQGRNGRLSTAPGGILSQQRSGRRRTESGRGSICSQRSVLSCQHASGQRVVRIEPNSKRPQAREELTLNVAGDGVVHSCHQRRSGDQEQGRIRVKK